MEIITFRYNDMQKTLLPNVEKPLVEKDLAHINEVLERGLNELNWNSPGLEQFLNEAMDVVKRVYTNVGIMKENFKQIRNIMTGTTVPLLCSSVPCCAAGCENNVMNHRTNL